MCVHKCGQFKKDPPPLKIRSSGTETVNSTAAAAASQSITVVAAANSTHFKQKSMSFCVASRAPQTSMYVCVCAWTRGGKIMGAECGQRLSYTSTPPTDEIVLCVCVRVRRARSAPWMRAFIFLIFSNEYMI